MTRQIPHDNEVIEDEEKVQEYINSHKNSVNHYKAFLKDLAGLNIRQGRFLEIGCGPGFLTTHLAQMYPNVRFTALEPSAGMRRFATAHARKTGVNERIDFIPGSVDDSGVMNSLGRFDVVYTTFSLHHWENPDTALRYLMQSVKKDGALLVHDLKRVSWLYHLPLKGGLIESIRAAYNCSEVRNMLKSMGITDFKITTPFPYFWMSVKVAN